MTPTMPPDAQAATAIINDAPCVVWAPREGGTIRTLAGEPVGEMLTIGYRTELLCSPHGELCDLAAIVEREDKFRRQLDYLTKMNWRSEGRIASQRRRRARDARTINALLNDH